MFAQVACLIALASMTNAVPLNSHALSSSPSRTRCKATLAALEKEDVENAIEASPNATDRPPNATDIPMNATEASSNDNKIPLNGTEIPPDRFMMKRFKLPDCETQEVQPAVRLSAFPNTGVTWIQYLLEEATKVATQNPQSITSSSGGSFLFPDEPVYCRAECGAQIFLHPNCTAGSVDANNVTIADGIAPEVFKNHYPDFVHRFALFETYNTIQTTILLARNPLDAYLGGLRHSGTESPTKVGDANPDSALHPDYHDPSEGCLSGFTQMRNETSGRGIDPLNICDGLPTPSDTFEEFLPLWCEFFTFWLEHDSIQCTEITVVRYEDLANITGDVLETILHEVGVTHQPEGIGRAAAAFPPNQDRLSQDVYFNKLLYANETIKRWADLAVRECGDRVEDFGYRSFLEEVMEHADTNKTSPNAIPSAEFEIPPDRFLMKRIKLPGCETQEMQPAIRLSAFPNTGVTWIQYLLEEATKVATQNPQSHVSSSGGSYLFPDEPVNCRAECGAQIFLHPNCTAGSIDANNVTIATGVAPEVFKNHYPDFVHRFALFETYNIIQATILLARNPLDAYLGGLRHSGTESPSKVGDANPDSAMPPADYNTSEGCLSGFAPMRNETSGRGIDPLNICDLPPIPSDTFEQFLPLWCDFFTFWLKNDATQCTEITVVRYEDLANITGDVLETILHEAGVTHQPGGIARAVAAFPPNLDRLSYDVYFNKLYYANETIIRWADLALRECGDRVEDLGYRPFLEEIMEHDDEKFMEHDDPKPPTF